MRSTRGRNKARTAASGVNSTAQGIAAGNPTTSGSPMRPDSPLPPAVASVPLWRRLWPWLAAVLSGVLLAVSYPPWNQSGFVWFALIPLVSAVWLGGSKPFALGFVTGVVFFTATFYWLTALGELYGSPVLIGLPLLLALYLALYPALWASFLARISAPGAAARLFPNSGRNLAIGATAACAWTALEWVRGWLFSGFGWNGLGVALYRDLPMIQIAEWTGVLGLSWLIAMVNVMGVIIVRRIIGELGPTFLKRIRWEFSLTVSLVIIVFGYGIRTLMVTKPGTATKDGPVSVAVVQPNIPQLEKFDPAFEDKVFTQLERLTMMAAGMHPSLIIWPEASTPRSVFADEDSHQFMVHLLERLPCPLLAGSVIDTVENTEPVSYNSAVLFPYGDKAASELPEQHPKIHLVPFGEYLPMRPLLNPIAGGLVPGDMDAGHEFTVMEVPKVGRFASLICFEDTLGDLTRKFVNRTDGSSPGLLINLTNDGWFLKTPAVEQHLANAVFRAVENRRPLLRCANTGVTGLVLPDGTVQRWIEPHLSRSAVRTLNIPIPMLTFYTRYGDWIAWVSGAIALLAIGLHFARRTSA